MDLASAELSYAASRTLGLPFSPEALDRIFEALLAGYHGAGGLKSDGSDLLSPKLDEESRPQVNLRRFRAQATKAATETAYYGELFPRLGLDPARLSWEEIARLPLTSKDAIRDHPNDFVCRREKPVFTTPTTGTTGRPTQVSFSANEMHTYSAIFAIGDLISRDTIPEDIILVTHSPRTTLGITSMRPAAERIGAMVILGGQVDPELTLAMLAKEYRLKDKMPRVSTLVSYPSYLGELIEAGMRLGYKASDFSLRRIDIGGEIVTEGVKRRAQQLFGPVHCADGYGMTETWPLGGGLCPNGHLHFGGASALLEFLAPDSSAPARPGEVARLVATPLPPYRDTTLLLRYDTEDMVRMLEAPPTCVQSHLTATSSILGKRRLSVQHDHGWTYPRQVLEALESVEPVPLPARCGFWAVPGGVAVEVVVRGDAAVARRMIGDSLEAHSVPLCALYPREDRGQLQHPYPLRGDLRETS